MTVRQLCGIDFVTVKKNKGFVMVRFTSKSVIFTLALDENTHEVQLKGSWNDWKPEAMKRNATGKYTKTKRLKPGRYEFGYEIDGVWVCDETLPTVASPFGSRNSLLEVAP
jgi:5'-AMP-activated protein kinase regulatory beta subunit